MTWVKLDTGFPRHRKVLALSLADRWAHICAMTWCAENHTDGVILEHELGAIPARKATATRLVAAGLWDAQDGGYRIHDWLDYNIASEDAKRLRKANSERQARHRSRVTSRVTAGVTEGVTSRPSPRACVDPTRPPSSNEEGSGSREDHPGAPAAAAPGGAAGASRSRPAGQVVVKPAGAPAAVGVWFHGAGRLYRQEVGPDGLTRDERDDIAKYRATGQESFLAEVERYGSPTAQAAAAAARADRTPPLRVIEGGGGGS